MESALKHYSSLFFLPPFKKALATVAVICVGLVGLSTFALVPSLLPESLALGVSLFATTVLFDYAMSTSILKRDNIFVMRRTTALSLFSWILWVAFVRLGVVFGAFFGLWWWIKLCLLGFSAVLTLRSVVFFEASSVGFARGAVASLLQPVTCIMPFMAFWAIIDSAVPLQVLPFLIISPLLCLASAYLFVFFIDRQGRQTYGIPSMALFKAFMQNWVVGLNEPIEHYLEQLGEDEDVEVSFLKLDSSKAKATIIVPTVHPGPFKNIGSSLLPSLLKHEFEAVHGGIACVPLGILGHELDLASQKQNYKIIDQVISSAKLEATDDKASTFVRVTEGFASASCQVFGKTVFLSFTLAPKTTEDLPQELSRIVREEADKLGLGCAIVVNAHNSITDETELEAPIEELRDVAAECLKKAASLSLSSFEVGAATVYPEDISLNDGMGQGGITAIVVKVGEQRTAYVVIDGNNMISGLREKILLALADSGFDESEVFTTDTHAVSAVVLGRRGYHPIGEAMNHELLIGYIKESVSNAAACLESCRAACLSMVVPKVRVIGKTRIHSLSTMVDMALQKAKQVIVPVFAFEGFLLVLFLSVL